MRTRRIITAFTILSALASSHAGADRLKNIVEIQGVRANELKGVGLVVGLAGTGDSVLEARSAQEKILRRLGVEVASLNTLAPDNVAVVMVTATLPPYSKEGTRIDISAASIFDSDSLEGGTLLETLLEGIDGEVYAVGQGPISVGGFNADAGGGTSVRDNHVTSGRIPMGGFVEREVPSTITDGERIMLLLKRPDFNTASNIRTELDVAFGLGTATTFGAGTVSIVIPDGRHADLPGFIAELNNLQVESDVPAQVVINERTGTLVVGGEVTIRPCHVAHGGLTIKVGAQPGVSQPNPLAAGQTVVTQRTSVEVEQVDARLVEVKGSSATEVAAALNELRVTPRDMITIFQALREAGVMDANLEIM